MAAATQDRQGVVDPVHGHVINCEDQPVAAATTIYAYTMVSFDAAGYAVPAADVAAQAGKLVVFALAGVDNSAGANGEQSVRCMIRGVARMETGALTAASRGTTAHVLDDQTLATSSVNSREIGRVIEWTTTRTGVQIG